MRAKYERMMLRSGTIRKRELGMPHSVDRTLKSENT